MLCMRQTILSTPYFQFEKRFDFLFVYVMNMHDHFLCLPSWHHGKRRKLIWKSHGILLADFRGNPVVNMRMIIGKSGECNLPLCFYVSVLLCRSHAALTGYGVP